MRRLFQFTALVVLALWLPTTVHCNLEAILGWAVDDCCRDHGEDGAAPVDHCAVEDGDYRPTGAPVMVAAPDLLMCWCGCATCVSTALAPPVLVTAYSESPLELACTWQFVERAALPARAPSDVS